MNRIEHPAGSIPETDQEANRILHELGTIHRQRDSLKSAMSEELAKLKMEYNQKLEPLNKSAETLHANIEKYCTAHRGRLTHGGRVKFHRFAAGEISWRTRPAHVTFRSKKTVIESCRSLGLTRFLRSIEEVNKEAMLADPEIARTLAGVSIGSTGEDFVAKPLAL